MSDALQKEINATELLMKISNDVAVVKNEISNMKTNMQEDMSSVNQRISTLENKVSTLEHSDDTKYASRYKRTIAYILTGLSGAIIAKLPDVIVLIIKAIQG